MQPVAQQIVSFLLVMLLGLFIGLGYECYCGLCRVWRPRRWRAHLGDLLFCLCTTFFAYGWLLFFTRGEVRAYVFVALILGLLAYRLVLRRFFCRVFSRRGRI